MMGTVAADSLAAIGSVVGGEMALLTPRSSAIGPSAFALPESVSAGAPNLCLNGPVPGALTSETCNPARALRRTIRRFGQNWGRLFA